MCYIDTVFWLCLEILDIFNSSANQILTFNFSNSCEQCPRLKRFPNFCLHKGNLRKPCLENFFIYFFMYRLFNFIYLVATT